MSNASHSDTDNISALRSITAQRIAQQLEAAGHAVPGGIFATEAGVAWLIDCTPRTLSAWRKDGTGPPAFMTARWLYPLDELIAWMQSRAAPNPGGSNRKR